jgi:hypothetical protein
MKRFCSILFSILLFAGAVAASAQVVPSATGRQVSITVGGMASAFQPDFAGNWQPPTWQYPIAQGGPQPLFGVGAYVDVRLRRWVQFEAEGRWMRWNQYYGISQDNYLIGPRIPVYHFWKATVYGKALAGYSRMSFDPAGDHNTFTDIAFGGGLDVKLTRKISIRAMDAEYHYWPYWGNTTLSPYGVSVGVGYRIF